MAATLRFAILMLFWPVLFGLVISLAIVGKGLRLIWLPWLSAFVSSSLLSLDASE
jgi:hypothetical protein